MSSTNQRKIRGTAHKRSSRGQSTKDKLLNTALVQLESHFPENITGEMLIEQSGVSRGSLYHHFVDVSDLLEQALVIRFSEQVDDNIKTLSKMMAESRSADDMYDGLCDVTEITQAPENRGRRFMRARLISFAENNDRLTQRLGAEQKRLTDGIAELFADAQQRGWMSKMFDAHAAAQFIQAYTLGRVINDISVDGVEQQHWNDLIKRVVKLVFCSQVEPG